MKFTHQPGESPIDGFTIRRGIHRGGFGEVYYAVSDAGKEVALKLIQHEQDVEVRGVTQCLNLKHPNLVNLYDLKTDAHGGQWVVMEYVNGTNLEDVLAAFPNGLPVEEVRDWLIGLAAGVSHLHERGIVHRDLKPANVYRENGVVKVGDVGLSKRLGSDRRGAHTQSVGTVYYMAPEVAKGQYGPEVDVYALGIMLYELLTGRVPFAGETTAEVLMKHLTARPDMSLIPARLRRPLEAALEKDPHKRTPSVRLLCDGFVSAIDGTHVTTATPPPPPISSRVVPPPPPAAPRRAFESKPHSVAVSLKGKNLSQQFMKWLVVIVGLLLFAPGTYRSWTGLGFIGIAFSVLLLSHHRSTSDAMNLTAAGDAPPNDSFFGQTSATASSRELDAAWRRLPLGSLLCRNSLLEISQSLALASLVSGLLTTGVIYSFEFFNKPVAVAVGNVVHGLAVVMTGTWCLLLAIQCIRRTDWGDRHRRLTQLAAGLITGSIAYGLDRFLLVEFPRMSNHQSAFSTLGVHELAVGHRNPTWLGYVVFFGGMFFLRLWWLDAVPDREKRFSLARLFTAWLGAFLWTTLFEFQGNLAMLWAVVMSATIQLASPWTGPRSHHSRRRG